MTLIQVLELISDSAEVRVYNPYGMEIAHYNGKDSIPTELNDYKIDAMYPAIETYKEKEIPYIAIKLM